MAPRDLPDRGPLCSVCIANYNGEHMLGACLDSLLAQQPAMQIEIIVHDDASSDGSLAVLARYAQVIVIHSERNVGFCVANNRMAQRARGDYLLLLNNDAALLPDALATLLHLAERQQPRGILTLPQYDWETGALVDCGCLLDPFYNPVPNLQRLRTDVAMVIGACLFVRRDTWHALGGFPEWFESIGEDLYLCCLARLRGLPVQVAQSSGYRHRQGASFSGPRESARHPTTTIRRRRLSERNKTWTLFVCTPTWAVGALMIAHVILLSLEGLALTALRRDRRLWKEIYGPAIVAGLRPDERVRHLRARVQATRKTRLRQYFGPFTFVPFKLRALLRHGLPIVR